MIILQGTELRSRVDEAIQKAKAKNAPIIVSEIQKIEHIDPISFFAAGNVILSSERFFWKDSSEEFFLVGLGSCKNIDSDKTEQRFFDVEDQWRSLLKDGIIIDDYNVSGTGPLMFGGFSFDPLKEKTPLWTMYPSSLFHVPKYMLTVVNGTHYLTTNLLISKDDDLALKDGIILEREDFLSKLKLFSTLPLMPPFVSYNEVVDGDSWKSTVREVVEDLQKEEELKKVVLARELRLKFQDMIPYERVVEQLLTQQKDSFIFAFGVNGDCFVGASPERLVKKEGHILFSTCLAGSIARGKTAEEDDELGSALLNDEKNLIEHQFVVEMIKDAMEKVCSHVQIPDRPSLKKVRDIQHLYTPVVGTSDKESSLLQLVKLLHPTPALGGFPQKLAVEKIRNVEKLDRGYYAAPLGWVDHKGNGEFAVAIRSGLIQGAEASLFAGCGIVKDSNADSEYKETIIKFRPMLSALGGINI